MWDIRYKMVEEDYRAWIRHQVNSPAQKKKRVISVGLYFVLAIVLLGWNYARFGNDVTRILPSGILTVLVGVFLIFSTSPGRQEEMAFKRSGLKKLRDDDLYPEVHITAGEKTMTMHIETREKQSTTEYSYTEIVGLQDIGRLFLIGVRRNWQFLAKSGFESEEQAGEFRKFLEEKMEDAKAHPENYPAPEALEQARIDQAKAASGGEEASSFEDEPTTRRVDTSNMGKLGKIAHMVTSGEDAAEQTAEAAEGVAEQATEAAEGVAEQAAEAAGTIAETVGDAAVETAEAVQDMAEAAAEALRAAEEQHAEN